MQALLPNISIPHLANKLSERLNNFWLQCHKPNSINELSIQLSQSPCLKNKLFVKILYPGIKMAKKYDVQSMLFFKMYKFIPGFHSKSTMKQPDAYCCYTSSLHRSNILILRKIMQNLFFVTAVILLPCSVITPHRIAGSLHQFNPLFNTILIFL